MGYIKLKEFCKKHSISYVTGNRWFNAGQIKGAIKSESGTILIPEDASKQSNLFNKDDSTSVLLNKAFEFMADEATIMDFASYIMLNFTVVLKNDFNMGKYVVEKKVKPSKEDIAEHYKKMMPEVAARQDTLKAIKEAIQNKNKVSGQLSFDFDKQEWVGDEDNDKSLDEALKENFEDSEELKDNLNVMFDSTVVKPRLTRTQIAKETKKLVDKRKALKLFDDIEDNTIKNKEEYE